MIYCNCFVHRRILLGRSPQHLFILQLCKTTCKGAKILLTICLPLCENQKILNVNLCLSLFDKLCLRNLCLGKQYLFMVFLKNMQLLSFFASFNYQSLRKAGIIHREQCNFDIDLLLCVFCHRVPDDTCCCFHWTNGDEQETETKGKWQLQGITWARRQRVLSPSKRFNLIGNSVTQVMESIWIYSRKQLSPFHCFVFIV